MLKTIHFLYPSLEEVFLEKISTKDYLPQCAIPVVFVPDKILREAALDPVTSIKITLYRLAKILKSLVASMPKRKKVTVQIELQARFDEASNISASKCKQKGSNHFLN
jgi:polyphosphate kinase